MDRGRVRLLSTRIEVVWLATSRPSEHGGTATRWTLSDIAATILNQACHEALSRLSVWRILDRRHLLAEGL